MSEVTKKFELLDSNEKRDFLDGLKTFLGYENDIKESRAAQKGQITVVSSKIPGMKKRDVRKLFIYFKKNTSPTELREDADTIEAVKEEMDDSRKD
jgi:hypothetical protein